MDRISIIEKQFEEAINVLHDFYKDKNLIKKIDDCANLIVNSFNNNGKVISCGNGGSHCDAMHFAEELTGKFRDDRKPLPAIAINDSSYITCVGNDYGYESIFSRFIEGLGNSNDVLFCLSTSGKSENIIKAISVAKQKSMKVIALTGNDGGDVGRMADIEIRVPHMGYADRIQEVHIKIIHSIILIVENILTNETD